LFQDTGSRHGGGSEEKPGHGKAGTGELPGRASEIAAAPAKMMTAGREELTMLLLLRGSISAGKVKRSVASVLSIACRAVIQSASAGNWSCLVLSQARADAKMQSSLSPFGSLAA
jgi:hypothetical protein